MGRTGMSPTGVKLRKVKTGNESNSYTLGLPPELGNLIPEGTRFRVELTEEGIIYRPIGLTPEPKPELPDWLKESKFGVGGR